MRSTRTKLMATKKAKWIIYGCSPHSLNKFAHDLLKIDPFKAFHKKAITFVSYFNQTLRARAILSKVQMEARGKIWAIWTFSPTCWCTVYLNQYSIMRSKDEIRRVSIYEALDGNDAFEMPIDAIQIVTSTAYWTQLSFVSNVFKLLSALTWFLESDYTSF